MPSVERAASLVYLKQLHAVSIEPFAAQSGARNFGRCVFADAQSSAWNEMAGEDTPQTWSFL